MDNKIITVILPTCEPDSMFEFLLPSIPNLKGLEDILEFNIIFQPPYNSDEMEKVVSTIRDNGFKVNCKYKNYQVKKPYTPLVKMRNDCALMSPDSDYYMVWDDDISILSLDAVSFIKQALCRLNEDDNLAVVSLYNQPINNHRENFYSTNAGLILRGGKYYGFPGYMPESLNSFGNVKTLVPYDGENLINLFGGFQDKFGAMCRLATGQTGISIINVPINHVENRKQKGAIAHGWDDAKYQSGSIAFFIQKYFNPRFLVTHSLTLFDRSLNRRIYPDHYDNGFLKDEYNIYDDRGFSWEFDYHNAVEWLKLNPNSGITLEQLTCNIPDRWKK